MRAVLTGSVVSAVAASVLLWFLLKSGFAWRIAVDVPNRRSLHAATTPRVGGLVVISIALIAMLVVAPKLQMLTVTASGLLAVCAVDDRRGLSVSIRLLVQLVAATVASFTLTPAAPWWLLVLSTVAIMWSMNLYNFMDGADGLAGGMAVFGFSALAIGAFNSSHEVTLACACIAGAAAGFLIHNFPPARVFLGDAGSVPLGFLAATIGIAGWNQGLWPVWFPVLVFSPFVVDATVTLARRALRGQRVWHAHREHLYQRMASGRLGHVGTATAWYLLMALVTGSATAAVRWPIDWQIALLLGWLTLYAVLYVCINRLVRRSINEA